MASEAEIDEYTLEDIAHRHPIGADLLVPFVILRLRRESELPEAILSVRLINIVREGEVQSRLRLKWSPASVPEKPPAVQDRTVTEWAACGVACAVAELYAGLRVTEVAREGERFDYWVNDGSRAYGLEVSGTRAQGLEARYRQKLRQLRENPVWTRRVRFRRRMRGANGHFFLRSC